jgi:hypothetical protein
MDVNQRSTPARDQIPGIDRAEVHAVAGKSGCVRDRGVQLRSGKQQDLAGRGQDYYVSGGPVLTDSSLPGGAPGIMSYSTGQVGNWSGGSVNANAGFPGYSYEHRRHWRHCYIKYFRPVTDAALRYCGS